MSSVELPLPDLPLNGSVIIQTALGPVMLCKTIEGIHALRPLCPHQLQSLEGARIRGTSLTCPHHGVRFNLTDGRSLSPLTPKPLDLLTCRVEGERVFIAKKNH